MSTPLIASLLALQEADAHFSSLRQLQAEIPDEIAAARARIEREEAAIAANRKQLQELEVRRSDLEGQVQEAEATQVRYKNQQLEVKKNEEYTALQHEIDNTGNRIAQLEDEELRLMLEIDQQKESAATDDEEHRAAIRDYERQIALLEEKQQETAAQINDAEAAFKAAAADLPPDALKTYEYVKTRVRKPPYIVPVQDQTCRGCFLKVSHETMSVLRGKPDNLPRCDSCGRLVYLER